MGYSPRVTKSRTRLSDFTFTLIQYDWYSSEKRKDTETDRGKRYVTMEIGITLFTRQVMPMIDSNHQKLGERRETDSPSEPLEGTTLADYLDLRLLASSTEIKYFCCFKPSGLWQFVMVTLGHKHTPLCVSSP